MQPDSLVQPSFNVGDCFSYTDPIYGFKHYFQQRQADVLHLNHRQLINSIHVDFLTTATNKLLVPISYEDFTLAMRETIYNLEINEFWKP